MARHIEVPHTSLQPETLRALVEEFITREGTDYGEREYSLEEKRASVMQQLARKQVAILFDLELESITLVRIEELARATDDSS